MIGFEKVHLLQLDFPNMPLVVDFMSNLLVPANSQSPNFLYQDLQVNGKRCKNGHKYFFGNQMKLELKFVVIVFGVFCDILN